MTDIDPTVIDMFRSSATIVVNIEQVGKFRWRAEVYDDFGFFKVSDTFYTKRGAKKYVYEQLQEVEEVLGGLTRG